MNDHDVFCPHCSRKIDVHVTYRQYTTCPACHKTFMVSPSEQSIQDANHQQQNTSSLFQTLKDRNIYNLPQEPIPDGYSIAMLYVGYLNVIGILGIIGGVICLFSGFAMRSGKFILDNELLVSIGVALILWAIPWFITAAFLKLFCGMAQNTAYLVALKEHELKTR